MSRSINNITHLGTGLEKDRNFFMLLSNKFTMLVVLYADFQEKMERPCDDQRITTAKWILRRKYGCKVNSCTETWIVIAGSSKDYHCNNNI
jgi:hypothetical protein